MEKVKLLCCFVLLSLLSILTIYGAAGGGQAGFRPGFCVRLHGGLSYLQGGDLNSGLKGFGDSAIYNYSLHGYSHSGAYQDMHTGVDLGGDLIFLFSPWLGLGIGSGYCQASKSSEIVLTGPATDRFILKPQASVIPIRAGLWFFLQLSDVLRISMNVGVEYDLASISADIRREFPSWWSEWDQDASGRGIGFQGAVGLEIRLSSAISLIVEGQGRYAKIKEFKGTNIYRTNSGYQEKQEGTLYYWTDYHTFRPFPYIFVWSHTPSDPWQQDVRKAEVDFSGGSLRGGIVLRF